MFMSTYFIFICYTGKVVAAGVNPNFLYGVTMLSNTINLFTYFKCRNLTKTWVYSIEWDLDTELFVIKQPKNVFTGIKEDRV